jgi:hypothetical protein
MLAAAEHTSVTIHGSALCSQRRDPRPFHLGSLAELATAQRAQRIPPEVNLLAGTAPVPTTPSALVTLVPPPHRPRCSAAAPSRSRTAIPTP